MLSFFIMIQWNKTYADDSSLKNVYSLIQTNDGGYTFACATNAYSKDVSYDALLVKIDSKGTIQWNQTYDLTEGFDYALDLIQTSDGGYAYAGITGRFSTRQCFLVGPEIIQPHNMADNAVPL